MYGVKPRGSIRFNKKHFQILTPEHPIPSRKYKWKSVSRIGHIDIQPILSYPPSFFDKTFILFFRKDEARIIPSSAFEAKEFWEEIIAREMFKPDSTTNEVLLSPSKLVRNLPFCIFMKCWPPVLKMMKRVKKGSGVM